MFDGSGEEWRQGQVDHSCGYPEIASDVFCCLLLFLLFTPSIQDRAAMRENSNSLRIAPAMSQIRRKERFS
jgi:hypothetical protein